MCLNIKICNFLVSILKINVSNFHPLEIVGCGGESQIQVGENLNLKTLCFLKVLH